MTASQRREFDDAELAAHALRIRGLIAEIIPQAIAVCVERNIAETMQKWLAHAHLALDENSSQTLALEATILAHELAIFTPSVSGTRPLDRLARQFKARSQDERSAMEYLTRAKFRLFRVVSPTQASISRPRISLAAKSSCFSKIFSR